MTLTSISVDICIDCLLIVANDDDSGIEHPVAHRAAMEREAAANAPYVLVPGDGEDDFSTARCGGCGGREAGTRHHAWLVSRA